MRGKFAIVSRTWKWPNESVYLQTTKNKLVTQQRKHVSKAESVDKTLSPSLSLPPILSKQRLENGKKSKTRKKRMIHERWNVRAILDAKAKKALRRAKGGRGNREKPNGVQYKSCFFFFLLLGIGVNSSLYVFFFLRLMCVKQGILTFHPCTATGAHHYHHRFFF